MPGIHADHEIQFKQQNGANGTISEPRSQENL